MPGSDSGSKANSRPGSTTGSIKGSKASLNSGKERPSSKGSNKGSRPSSSASRTSENKERPESKTSDKKQAQDQDNDQGQGPETFLASLTKLSESLQSDVSNNELSVMVDEVSTNIKSNDYANCTREQMAEVKQHMTEIKAKLHNKIEEQIEGLFLLLYGSDGSRGRGISA